MKTVYMRQLYLGTIGDTKNLETHFALMAEQGWMVDNVGAMIHRYRAIEPCKRSFIVDFLPQITAFDYPDNEDAQDYRRICEESGWTFVTARKQLHIFYADEKSSKPIPIHTDNKIQAQIYLKMCRKYELLKYVSALLMLGFFVLPQLIYDGAEIFLSNMLIAVLVGCPLLIIGYIWNFGFILNWYRRTRQSAKHNLQLPAVNYRLSLIRRRVLTAGVLVGALCLLVGVALEALGGTPIWLLIIVIIPLLFLCVGFWMRRQIDTKRRSRRANTMLASAALAMILIIMTNVLISVILQSIPNRDMSVTIGNHPALTLYSIGILQEPEVMGSRVRGSIAVPIHYSYWEMNRQGNVHTEVYRPISILITRGLYNRFASELKEGHSLAEIRGIRSEVALLTVDEAAFWGADEGIVAISLNIESLEPILHSGSAIELILLSGNTILRLSVFGENIEKETLTQAVRELMRD